MSDNWGDLLARNVTSSVQVNPDDEITLDFGDLLAVRAIIPSIATAVRKAGDGGMRVTLDIAYADEDAADAFVKACRGKTFWFVVVDSEGRGLEG